MGGAAKKTYLCDWGDCTRETAYIVVSTKDERKRFCSFAHLCEWAKREMEQEANSGRSDTQDVGPNR